MIVILIIITTSHQSSVISHQSSVINHQSSFIIIIIIIHLWPSSSSSSPPVISHQSSVISHQSSVTSHQSSSSSSWSSWSSSSSSAVTIYDHHPHHHHQQSSVMSESSVVIIIIIICQFFVRFAPHYWGHGFVWATRAGIADHVSAWVTCANSRAKAWKLLGLSPSPNHGLIIFDCSILGGSLGALNPGGTVKLSGLKLEESQVTSTQDWRPGWRLTHPSSILTRWSPLYPILEDLSWRVQNISQHGHQLP